MQELMQFVKAPLKIPKLQTGREGGLARIKARLWRRQTGWINPSYTEIARNDANDGEKDGF